MVCKECSAPLREDAAFCGVCAARVDAVSEQHPQKSCSMKPVIVVGIAVACIAIGAILEAVFQKSSQPTQEEPTPIVKASIPVSAPVLDDSGMRIPLVDMSYTQEGGRVQEERP